MKINSKKEDLEKALGSLEKKPKKEAKELKKEGKVSKEEEIGFHKGALNTLIAERNELIKMIANVETIMAMHLKRLKDLGVKIEFKEPKK
jgi:hypothetical protein